MKIEQQILEGFAKVVNDSLMDKYEGMNHDLGCAELLECQIFHAGEINLIVRTDKGVRVLTLKVSDYKKR